MSTSMITINPALELRFGMPACGLAAGARAAAWPTPAADAVAGNAVRTHALSQGVVAFGTKRRTGKGSLAWRTPDC